MIASRNPPNSAEAEQAIRQKVVEIHGVKSIGFLNSVLEDRISRIGAPVETIGERHLIEAMQSILTAQENAATEYQSQIAELETGLEADPEMMVVVERTETPKGMIEKSVPARDQIRMLHKQLLEVQAAFTENAAKLLPKQATSGAVGIGSTLTTVSDEDLDRALEYERVKQRIAIPVEPEEVI